MNNGKLESLATAFPGYSFTCFPEAKHEFLRIQCGRLIIEDIALPPNEKAGFAGFAERVHRFHLKAWAATPDELAKVLNGSDNP